MRGKGNSMTGGTSGKGISRRTFIKYGAAAAAAGFVGYSGLVYPGGLRKFLSFGQKPWELDVGVVDYEIVKRVSYGPPELGFAHDIRQSPPDARILNVAQWYDYWPGKVVGDFTTYMEQKWNIKGVRADWTSNIYTSNEELFTWITQTGRKFDVMVPTNYNIETMEKAGLIVNLNKEWIPYYSYIFGKVPSNLPQPFIKPTWADFSSGTRVVRPIDSPSFASGYNNYANVDFRDPSLNQYQYRGSKPTYPNPRGTDHFTWNADNGLLAVPYQWGTTGIGYRTDIFRREDVETLGWEVLKLDSYTNPDVIDPDTGKPKVFDLGKKKMMLDDMREVFTAGLKAVGWERQVAEGLQPTALVRNVADPSSGDYQWSANEVAEDKLRATQDWLLAVERSSFGFNTPQQGPWLVSGTMYIDQAWSGDVMYAVRPNSNQHLPVDYLVPKQGGARWIDNLAIHRESQKLWLSHEFINYIHEPSVQAAISSWNLYATPNSWAFVVLDQDPGYEFVGQNRDGTPYHWKNTIDSRIYSDIAIGNTNPPVLVRCEYQKDVGVRNNLRYFQFWRHVKF